jgi:hypothetical protein
MQLEVLMPRLEEKALFTPMVKADVAIHSCFQELSKVTPGSQIIVLRNQRLRK